MRIRGVVAFVTLRIADSDSDSDFDSPARRCGETVRGGSVIG
jgi:hypothetical protein